MQLNFKDYFELFGFNKPGRAGQHFWLPEKPLNSFQKPKTKTTLIKNLKNKPII